MEEAFIMAELFIKGIKSSTKAQEPTLTYLKGLEETLQKMKNTFNPPRSSSSWSKKKQNSSGWNVGSNEWEKGLPPPPPEIKKEDAPKES